MHLAFHKIWLTMLVTPSGIIPVGFCFIQDKFRKGSQS